MTRSMTLDESRKKEIRALSDASYEALVLLAQKNLKRTSQPKTESVLS